MIGLPPPFFGSPFPGFGKPTELVDFSVTAGFVPAVIFRQREKLMQDGRNNLNVLWQTYSPGNPRGVVGDGAFIGVVQVKQPPIRNVFLKGQVGSVSNVIADVERVMEQVSPHLGVWHHMKPARQDGDETSFQGLP